MKNVKKADVLVIGAGMGGLAAAALWAQQGSKVHLLESHSLPGGCAGFFKRKHGFYDVGATTLSGLTKNRPTQRLLQKLEIFLKTTQSDPGITVHYNNKKFLFYSDPVKFQQEIMRHFNFDISKIIINWGKVETGLWSCLKLIEAFQYKKLRTYKVLLKLENFTKLLNPRLYFCSFYNFLPKELKNNEDFINIVDQILLISTQQSSKSCPAFMGIMAFMYPFDTYGIVGGMRSLVLALTDKIKEFEGEIHYRNPCKKVVKQGKYYLVESEKTIFKVQKLICNIAPERFDQIFQSKTKYARNKGFIWGALTAYLSISTQKPIKEIYHQIHLEKDKSLFISFSVKKNNYQGRDYQQVSVSTHTKTSSYGLRDKQYGQNKEEFKTLVINTIRRHFKEYGIEDIYFDSVGTPLTFKHYTSRPQGEVGGLIHKSLFDFRRLMKNSYQKDHLYFVGDYSFPGQGIVSVFQSALNTLEDLT